MALWHLRTRFGDMFFFFLLTTGQDSEPPQSGYDAGKSLKAYELGQLWLLGSEADVLLIIYIAWPSRDLC